MRLDEEMRNTDDDGSSLLPSRTQCPSDANSSRSDDCFFCAPGSGGRRANDGGIRFGRGGDGPVASEVADEVADPAAVGRGASLGGVLGGLAAGRAQRAGGVLGMRRTGRVLRAGTTSSCICGPT